MQDIFGLLFFIFIILTIIGIFKPNVVKQTSRLKGFLYPFAGALVSLSMVGILAPKVYEAENNATSLKSEPTQEPKVTKPIELKETNLSTIEKVEHNTSLSTPKIIDDNEEIEDESDEVNEYILRQVAKEAGADYDKMQSELQKNMDLLKEKYSN